MRRRGSGPDPFVDEVLERLQPLRVTSRAMFGAYGLYLDGVFFAIVDDGRVYFKTDAGTRPEYEALGSEPFRFSPAQESKSYYEVPADVFEEPHRLAEWARRAAAARRRA